MSTAYPASSRPLPVLGLLVALATGCHHAAPPPAPNPGVNETGQQDPVPAHESFTVESRAVGETRRINVHTPKGYTGSARFPVLYMPDGGVEEDFPHVVNTLDSLVALKQARPFIVVGIENTQRRRDMTGPTRIRSDSAIAPRVGGSAAFRAFIRDELFPEIDRRYRTTGERAIIGESLAGLFVVETMFSEPGMFDRYIAFSPSLWWNDDGLLRTAPERLGALAGQGRTLYLSAANEEGIAPQADTLATLLRRATLGGFTLHYDPRPGEKHSTIYRAAGPAAMRRVLGKR
ncbi:MAG: alpha/beta hydrolase-fold protein [Gemmatimonadales bacterium]